MDAVELSLHETELVECLCKLAAGIKDGSISILTFSYGGDDAFAFTSRTKASPLHAIQVDYYIRGTAGLKHPGGTGV